MSSVRIVASCLLMLLWIGFTSGISLIGLSSLLNPQPGVGLLDHSEGHPPVRLDVFIDLTCNDSRKSWTTMKQLSAEYGDMLEVVIQQFPLPYNTHAFIITQGYFLVHRKSPHTIANYTELLFEHLETFSNENTFNLSSQEIIRKLAKLQFWVTKIDPEYFEENIHRYRQAAIKNWEYTASRDVRGTPWYLVNGHNDYSINMHRNDLGFEEWKLILGPKPIEEFTGDDLTNVISRSSELSPMAALWLFCLFVFSSLLV